VKVAASDSVASWFVYDADTLYVAGDSEYSVLADR
jgi:hypothetical protein